jgi:hypothetical protein
MDPIERYTQQWIDDFAGRGRDWTAEGHRRPLALDRAERAICDPGAFRVMGSARDELHRRRQFAEELLAGTDRELDELVARRLALAARVEACTVAIAGTGWIEAGRGASLRQRLPGRRAQPVPDPMPSDEDRDATLLSGHPLRLEIEALLRSVRRPLGLREIERLLRFGGVVVAGRPSQTLTNALRPARADGSIVRVARGHYRST